MDKIITLCILVASMLYTAPSQARNCADHPIYCKIIENKSDINKKYAFKLSNLIYKAAKKYEIPAMLYTSILMQESRYTLNIKNGQCGVLEPDYKSELCIYVDFGIAQINYRTAKKYNMDFYRLLNDLEYSVNAGAKALSWFHKTYAHKEQNWWVRYNCGTKPSINRKTCNKYLELVGQYL